MIDDNTRQAVLSALEQFKAAIAKRPSAKGAKLHCRAIAFVYPPCYCLQVWIKEDQDSGGLWQCFVDEEGTRLGAATYRDFWYSTNAVAPEVKVEGL